MEDKVTDIKIRVVSNGYIATCKYFGGEDVYIAESVPQLLNILGTALKNPKEI